MQRRSFFEGHGASHSIRLFLTVFCLALFLSGAGYAETLYVKDVEEITLRTGPFVDRKVVDVLPSGTKVEVLNVQGDYTRVSLADARNGWVLSRYLTDRIPNAYRIAAMDKAHRSLVEETEALRKKNEEMAGRIEGLEIRLKEITDREENLKKAYEDLKGRSGRLLTLEAERKELALKCAALEKKSETIDLQLIRLMKSYTWGAYITGAGVLVFGMILGYTARRDRKKRFL